MQINVFHRDLLAIAPEHDLQGDSLSRLCTRIKEGVQAHTGITEGTLFRDQGWYFYELGRLIERADQTTRLLDIKLPPAGAAAGSEEKRLAELTQWSGVLRAAAGYHAFRRVAPVDFGPEDVVPSCSPTRAFRAASCSASARPNGTSPSCAAGYGLRGTRSRWSRSRICAPPSSTARPSGSSRTGCMTSWTGCSAT